MCRFSEQALDSLGGPRCALSESFHDADTWGGDYHLMLLEISRGPKEQASILAHRFSYPTVQAYCYATVLGLRKFDELWGPTPRQFGLFETEPRNGSRRCHRSATWLARIAHLLRSIVMYCSPLRSRHPWLRKPASSATVLRSSGSIRRSNEGPVSV